MEPQEHAQFQALHYQMSRDVTSKTAARKNTETISHFKKESGSGHLKQLRVRVFTLKHQFHNQSDGSLTSNKSNGFCLLPKILLWEYVSLVSAYKMQRNHWLLYESNKCTHTALHCNYHSDIHSSATLLGTPAQLHDLSQSHGSSSMYLGRYGQDKLKSKNRASEPNMLVPDRLILSISENADLLGFFTYNSTYLGFTENGPKKRKYLVSSSSVGRKLQRSEENGQTGLSW